MLKAYKEYKDTNYDWLPRIPAHWKWVYLSQSCKEQCVKNSEDKENKVLSLSYGNIIIKKNINFGLVPKEYSSYQIVDKGNIILRLTDLQNDHTSLRTGLVKERGIITSAYTCLKPYENPNYLQYLLHSYDTLKVFYGMGGGVRQSIGFKEIRNMNIPLPPRPEQDQIVRYLDWKVSMINKYINAKKRQIELLKERKQAIINQAVTKGLDSKVPVKDSGIEWLGKIPAHWEVKQLSRVANVILSGLDKKSYPNEKGVKLCNYVDVYRNDFIHRNMDFMDATANENEYVNLLLKKGDVIITKDSESWDDIAVPAIVIQDLVNICCGYHLAILRCKDSDLDPLYLYYIFQTRFVEIQQKLRAKGVIRFSLGYQSIHDTNIIIPPLSEQFNIATYLKKDIENINQLISFATNEIQFIHEYRIRLISDVVTGKVNVQNIKIPNYTPYTPEILNSEFDNSMLKGNLND